VLSISIAIGIVHSQVLKLNSYRCFSPGSIDQDACRFFLYESGFALFIALLINIAVISVSGTVCFRENLSADDADKCSDLSLDNSSFLLKVVLLFVTIKI
jgi:hypothetical protein